MPDPIHHARDSIYELICNNMQYGTSLVCPTAFGHRIFTKKKLCVDQNISDYIDQVVLIQVQIIQRGWKM